MVSVYRPTLHQLIVVDLDGTTPDIARAAVERAANHFSAHVTDDVAAQIRAQYEQLQILRERDIRFPLVISEKLIPVDWHENLQGAIFIYQDGTAILIHLIWHLNSHASVHRFSSLVHPYLLDLASMGRGVIYEGVLGTAVANPAGAEADIDIADEERILEGLLPSLPTSFDMIRLNGARLHVPNMIPYDTITWPAAILFDDNLSEKSDWADRLTTVIWPLVVHYGLGLDRHYLRYREYLAPLSEQRRDEMQQTLARLFGEESPGRKDVPLALSTQNPDEIQDVLVILTRSQFALTEVLGQSRAILLDANRGLENLARSVAQITAYADIDNDARFDSQKQNRLMESITGRGRHFLKQIEADVTALEHQAEQAERASDIVRTQADIIEARYERRLTWVIGLVGVMLAIGEFLDKDLALVLYTNAGLGRLWEFLGGPVLTEVNQNLVLSYFRLAAVFGLGLFVAFLIWLLTHLGRRRN